MSLRRIWTSVLRPNLTTKTTRKAETQPPTIDVVIESSPTSKLAPAASPESSKMATYTYTPRVAIITGAVGDLGKFIARRLADDGFDLALNDLPAQRAALDALVAEIQVATGRKVIAVTGDVSVEKDVQALVERTAKELGSVDAMVSNVGIFKALPIDAMDQETWDKIFSVNVRGMLFCYKYAARQMIAQGRGGRLIGGCSVAGLTGAPLCSAYCSSKFAVRGLTQTAAMEYAAKGITANAYAPGFIGGTRMWDNLRDSAEAIMGIPKGGFEQHALTNIIKLGHLGRPEDIAGLVSFLASKDSAYVTGQTYSSDGGMHIA